MFQFHPYFIPVFASAIITGYIAAFALERRKCRGAAVFSLLMFLLFWWSLFYALELVVTDFTQQTLFLRIQYLAIPFVPVALLYFVLEYGGYYRFLNLKFFGPVLLPPIAAVILLITNSYHHLFFINEYVIVVDEIFIRGFSPAPAYTAIMLYCGILYFISAAILIHIHLSSQGNQKIQSALLLIAVLAPLSVGVLYNLGIMPYPYLDVTVIIFPVSGICVMISLFKYSFFEITPLPKEILFSTLAEGMVVLDDKHRILDINTAARTILEGEIEADGSVFFDKDTFLNKYRTHFTTEKNLVFLAELKVGEDERYFAVSITPVFLDQERPLYRVIVIKDITSEKRYETELKKSKSSLRIANEKIGLLNSITRHDILNSITILSGYTEMLRDKIPDEGEEKVYVENISTAIEKITDQIRFTADYQNMGVEDPVWQNLDAMIMDAWHSLGQKAAIRLEKNVPENLEIYADMLLEKVFYNLFENTTRHGTGATKIVVSFREQPDETAVLIVEDDGIGVPDTIKEKIFSKGFGRNTGLGLFLVTEILAITQVQIVETGKEGQGARFEMLIHKEGWKMRPGSDEF